LGCFASDGARDLNVVDHAREFIAVRGQSQTAAGTAEFAGKLVDTVAISARHSTKK
jgi:hypothetical protein